MEPATILVLVLCAGVVALLVWFEINSRRNEASKKLKSTPAQLGLETLPKEGQINAGSDAQKKHAA